MLTFASGAHAATACRETFSKLPSIEVASPQTVLTRLYDESQFLGIAVADHANFQPFHRLTELLELRGADPQLKTVVIESSYVLADLYARASVEPMTLAEFQKAAAPLYPSAHEQDAFMVEHVFPLLRKINERRPNDPVVAVPVDGITAATAMETAFGISTPARDHSARLTKSIDTKSVSNVYGSSILRERETARHFRELVADKYPERKSIIIYQGAHIFKNLGAVGADTDSRGKVVKRAYLGWINVASAQLPALKRGYKVVAVDNRSRHFAPNGQLNLPAGIKRSAQAQGIFWKGTTSRENPIFTSGSFMATYRNSTTTSVKPGAEIFDAAIIEP